MEGTQKAVDNNALATVFHYMAYGMQKHRGLSPVFGRTVLDIDKEAFKKAPSFSSNNWPVEPSSTWSGFYRPDGISHGLRDAPWRHGAFQALPDERKR
jgi:hypothetical protein